MATLDGTIQPPPANWDPYATSGSTPPTLLQQDPYIQFGPPRGTFATMTRLLQEIRLDYLWMPGNGVGEFGINDVELSATFGFPLFNNPQTPLLVTPGFAMHYWSGPKDNNPVPPTADLPPYVFDAYLDGAWNPQVTSWLSGELSLRIGVYSDFQRVTNESIRYIGNGFMVLSFTPSFKVKAGVMYLDRNRIKILPSGGVIWTPGGPGGDVRFEILFPNPKLARRLANYGNTQWWAYVSGDYGGGAWTVKRVGGVMDGVLDSADYNDIRVALGVEFLRQGGLSGLFEVGLAFDREIYYRSRMPPSYRPNPTVLLRGGLAY